MLLELKNLTFYTSYVNSVLPLSSSCLCYDITQSEESSLPHRVVQGETLRQWTPQELLSDQYVLTIPIV